MMHESTSPHPRNFQNRKTSDTMGFHRHVPFPVVMLIVIRLFGGDAERNWLFKSPLLYALLAVAQIQL